ncbi:MAG: cell division protein FtsZ [Thermoplasmata archaeon]|nr:MAG: cell division protein FtsZ [Thermoplasmata archaeon]
MDSIVSSAAKYAAEREALYKEFGDPKILVIGCGGAGNNSINRLHNIGVHGAETIAVNTDKQHLDIIEADKKILIGKNITKGLGAGGHPEIGEDAADQAKDVLEEVLGEADLVFIAAGMGGGTGTGSAPILAEIAKSLGAIVVGIATTPFDVERARQIKARSGLEKFRKRADSVIVLDNNRLLEFVPNLPIDQAFSVMDQLISEVIKGITETITKPSLINLDFADVKSIMCEGGTAMMLYGEGMDQEPEQVVIDALNNPLLDVDYTGATGALIHITGGSKLALRTVNKVAESVTYELDSSANIILGARTADEFNDRLRLMVIMTGVHSPNVLSPTSQMAASVYPDHDAIGQDFDYEIAWIR